MNNLICAKLVFDGSGDVLIPSKMGTPRDDQMQGSPAERLVEIAGRVCYDSLGKGRPSFTVQRELPIAINPDGTFAESQIETLQGYHEHIAQVGHGSVWEHFNFTIQIDGLIEHDRLLMAWLCVNRPGVLLLPAQNSKHVINDAIRITANLRSVVEWEKFTDDFYVSTGLASKEYRQRDDALRGALKLAANRLAPHIVSVAGASDFWEADIVSPSNDHERWISMYLTGSRGLSHELVRHGDFTAISQRSTRFVDESESPWVEHPLETAWRANEEDWSEMNGRYSVQSSRRQYRRTVKELEPWLIARGIDKLGARKQARGAARGCLGNALHTELIFSANVAQWKRMLRQRASVFADAEIRELFCKALGELKRSQYASRFENWSLAESPDNIGQVAVEANWE
jgi:thymidylate synthase ThyX